MPTRLILISFSPERLDWPYAGSLAGRYEAGERMAYEKML